MDSKHGAPLWKRIHRSPLHCHNAAPWGQSRAVSTKALQPGARKEATHNKSTASWSCHLTTENLPPPVRAQKAVGHDGQWRTSCESSHAHVREGHLFVVSSFLSRKKTRTRGHSVSQTRSHPSPIHRRHPPTRADPQSAGKRKSSVLQTPH